MKVLSISSQAMDDAVSFLREGGTVAYPTETVYGLAVNPFSETALHGLYTLKARDPRHPVLLIVANETQLAGLTTEVSPHARACIARFWPGPLSLLLPPAPGVPASLLGPEGRVCVRCPGLAAARNLCERFGGALTSTSANLSGQPPARSVQELQVPGLAFALDGGVLSPGPPSTVYDPGTRQVLREGRIPAEALQQL